MHLIDLNCDLGESYGRFSIGNDTEIMPYISSCNIACGFHAGDPLTIKKTIALALKHRVKIGAHPSFPDLQGFGRRKMNVPQEELLALMQFQIGAMKSMVEIQGGQLHHVKPHGALYNMAAEDPDIAQVIVNAVQSVDENLFLVGPAENAMARIAQQHGISYIAECFADRRYTDDLKLVGRDHLKAMIEDPQEAVRQVLDIVLRQQVSTIDGTVKKITAQTVCIHGDQPKAVDFAKQLHASLVGHDVEIGAVDHG